MTEQIPIVSIVRGSLFAGAVGWPLVSGKQGVGTLLWNLVAIASWLAEVSCHVAVVSRRASRSAVGIGMWLPSAMPNRQTVVATVLWVVERGCHSTVGNGMQLPWCSGEQSVVVMVAE